MAAPDSSAVVPAHYKDTVGAPDNFRKRYMAAAHLGGARAAELAPLATGLPTAVLDDILTVMADRSTASSAPGTIGHAFKRAAHQLEDELHVVRGFESTPHLEDVLVDHDGAFLEAALSAAAMKGDAVEVPAQLELPVPRWTAPRTLPFRWIRLAAIRINRVHRPGCSSFRGYSSRKSANVVPAWQVSLISSEDLCGVCGGPGIFDGLALAHFSAASDVWATRGGGGLEDWQVGAVTRLVRKSAELEPEVAELTGQLRALMRDELSDDEAYAARAFINKDRRPRPVPIDVAEVGRQVAIRRLNISAQADSGGSPARSVLPADATWEMVYREVGVIRALDSRQQVTVSLEPLLFGHPNT